MARLILFGAIIAAVVGLTFCSANPLSPPRGAENSIVAITAEVEEEASPLFILFPSSRKTPKQKAPKTETVTHTGTGFALCSHGRDGCKIYTCEHVIRGAKTIYVTLRTGKVQWAKLLRANKETDLAELEVDVMPPCLVLRSYPPRSLEKVWEIGNPADLRWVVTTGYFLSFAGTENIFLIDTWFGNSGSPIMDNSGRVIGMTHNIIKGTRFTGGGTLQELQNFIHPERPR